MKKHAPRSPQKILQSYRHYLEQVVGLAPRTCRNQLRDVASFLEAVPIRAVKELTALQPVQLTSYLTLRSADCQPGSLQQVASSLRQFLRFSQQQGWTGQSLSLSGSSNCLPSSP